MSTIPDSICFWCKHLNSSSTVLHQTCKAFPQGIPHEIFRRDPEQSEMFDHQFPYDDNNDVLFELETDFDKLSERPYFTFRMDRLDWSEADIYKHINRVLARNEQLRRSGRMKPYLIEDDNEKSILDQNDLSEDID